VRIILYLKKKFFYKLFCIFVLIISIYYISKNIFYVIYKSNKIIIKKIEIIGIKNLKKHEIEKLFPFKIGDNILKIDLLKIKKDIKKNKPELEDIFIKCCFRKIKIKICERNPEAYIILNNENIGIDYKGVLFPLNDFINYKKIPKIIYKTNYEKKILLDFIKKFKTICDDFFYNIVELRFNNIGDIVFVTDRNIIVFWGCNVKQDDLKYKFEKFIKIYNDAINRYKIIEYINMTNYSSGKVFVKPLI
jgi:cell division protein FtsQ